MAEQDLPRTRYRELSEVVAHHTASLQRLEESSNNIESSLNNVHRQLASITLALERLSKAPHPEQPEGPSSSSTRNPLFVDDNYRPPLSPKIDLYKYDGTEDPSGWILLADQFFLLRIVNRASLVQSLEKRFGPTEYEDPEGEITKLRQTSTVAAYQTQFEKLAQRVDGLPDRFLARTFVSGLRDDIKGMVKLLRPTSLKEAIGLARLQEKHHCRDRKSFSAPNKPTTFAAPTPTKPSPSLKTQRLSYDEMKARRDKGLCYYCDDKFGPGHKCKTRTFFFLEGQEDSDMDCSDDDSPVSPPPESHSMPFQEYKRHKLCEL
ncbi:hypothetical protein Pint_35012 [Pistacia integerrima]|uniref:Uncharacterized protein n=1 Tax=Pistacia integerrima TaxID=434235 RepID=A0ACC0Y4P6_9ROSI|nr:hypothetical protein Pint_35012 [Pistacia integerrima]